jgi:hypothetical protein
LRTIIAAVGAAAALALAGTAAAGSGVTLSGGATVSNGIVTLTSNTGDASSANDASAVTFAVPSGTTFADLKTLSADYEITAGGCGGGSPRFSVTLADGKNLFAYIGPAPSFNNCPLNTWQSTGNLVGNDTAGVWDTSQEIGGTQVSTYSAALAALGTKQVSSVSLVVDGGWAMPGKQQTVLARNITVATTTGTTPPPSKNPAQACKAERDHDADAFRERYGSNHNKANAFGKCVSEHARGKEARSFRLFHAQRSHHHSHYSEHSHHSD